MSVLPINYKNFKVNEKTKDYFFREQAIGNYYGYDKKNKILFFSNSIDGSIFKINVLDSHEIITSNEYFTSLLRFPSLGKENFEFESSKDKKTLSILPSTIKSLKSIIPSKILNETTFMEEEIPLVGKNVSSIVLDKNKIGEGTFGCLFLPPFPCENHDESEYEGLVSKVLTLEEARNEFEIAKKLKSIDILESGTFGELNARYKYGVYALDMCHFPLNDPRQIEAFYNVKKPCKGKLIKKSMGEEEPYDYIVHMEKAEGDLFYAFIQKNILKNCKKIEIKNWIKCLKNVLMGLENMHKHNIYHFDIKEGNTLFFGTLKKPITCKLIDFGLTQEIKSSTFLSIKKWNIPIAFSEPWSYYLPCAPLLRSKMELIEKYGEELGQKILNQEEYIIEIQKKIDFLYDFYKENLINDKRYYFTYYLKKEFPSNDFLLDSLKTTYKKYNGTPQDLAQSVDLYGFALLLDSFYSVENETITSLLNFLFIRALHADLNHKLVFEILSKIENQFD